MMLLTIPEAAERLSVSRNTVDREISAGRIPIIKIRGACRIDADDLTTYIQSIKQHRQPIQCQSENAAQLGTSGFRRTARESSGALADLLQKRKR